MGDAGCVCWPLPLPWAALCWLGHPGTRLQCAMPGCPEGGLRVPPLAPFPLKSSTETASAGQPQSIQERQGPPPLSSPGALRGQPLWPRSRAPGRAGGRGNTWDPGPQQGKGANRKTGRGLEQKIKPGRGQLQAKGNSETAPSESCPPPRINWERLVETQFKPSHNNLFLEWLSPQRALLCYLLDKFIHTVTLGACHIKNPVKNPQFNPHPTPWRHPQNQTLDQL